jgi:hypothetical protein
MHFYVLLYAFFSFLSPPLPETGSTTRLQYIVIKDGKRIGEIRATRAIEDNQTIYDVITTLSVKVLLKQDISYSSHSVYQNGILLAANAKSFLNNKLHHKCTTTWKVNKYEIRRDEDKHTLNRQVTYSGAQLYFKEPVGISNVYSEMSGHDNTMVRTGDHNYTLTDGKTRKKNKYMYKGGMLDHAFINHSLLDFEVQRVY